MRRPPRGKPRRPKPTPTFDGPKPRFAEAWTAILSPSAVNLVTVGHPWLFSGALLELLPPTASEPEAGGQVVVFGPDGAWLGIGSCNPQSHIAVRMMLRGEGQVPNLLPTLAQIARGKLESARQLRALLGRPGEGRGAWRLINAEGDGLPGMTVDVIGDGAVVVVSTAGAAKLADTVADWLQNKLGSAWVLVRAANDVHPSEGLPGGQITSRGTVPEKIEVAHSGATMPVEPAGGQKAGLYTDQLDNHVAVAAYAKDRFVVDAYCNLGGFGIHAALAGARKVLAIDASQRAAEAANEAAALSGVSDRYEVVTGDAVHLLGDLAAGIGAEDGKPELVIVDPPKFATRADVVDDALKKYAHLNATAMSALAPGGVLVSCSCSGRVDRTAFVRMLGHAARRAGREVQLLELRGAAADHPTLPVHTEAQYLKVAICRVL